MSDVFISYSRLDKEFVGKLHESLLAKGQNIWVDWEDIPPSQSWWDEIQKGIAKANNVVLILSPNSMGSVVCHMEIEYARSLKKRIIPVLHAPYERDTCVAEISKRLAKPEEFTTRELWGSRQPLSMYDANDGDLKHINFFFFGNDDDFKTKFESLFEIIHTDYAHKEQHTTFLLRASEWNRRGRDVSFLLLDTELDEAESWLKSSPGKQPPPTELQLAYIQASEKRTRQLRNIRRASIIGTAVAGIALIFAIGASFIGVQATQSANLASTREAAANNQVASANGQLTAVPPTLTQVNKAVVTAQGAANIAKTAVVNAQATVTQIPPTLTQAAVIYNVAIDFANVMFQVDNPAGQIEQMNQLVEKYNNESMAYMARGAYYDYRAETDLAIKDYTQAIVLDPQNSDAYTLRANLILDKGEVDAALEDYTQAIALNPKNATAYHNRGLLHGNSGDLEGALADVNQAISLEPQNANFYVSRGILENEMGNFDKALVDFNKSLTFFSNNADAYLNRGVSHDGLSDYPAAIADYTQAIALDPKNAAAYTLRGTARAGLNDLKGALEDFNQAISLNPQQIEAYFSRGDLYFVLYKAETDKAQQLIDLKNVLSDYRTAESLGYKITSDQEETLQQIEALLATATPKP